MELCSGKCVICDCQGKVFLKKLDVFIKQIQNSFFSTNKDAYPEEFSSKLKLCVICVQKLQLSHEIKKTYDEMCNRNNRPHKNKCFFCESRANVLVDTDVNVYDFEKKIKVFLNSVRVYHSCEGLSACVKCLYNLNIWSEIRTQLYSILDIPEIIPRNEDQLMNDNFTTPVMTRSTRSINSADTSLKKLRNSRITTRSSFNKHKWKLYLRKKLKSLKTANEFINTHNLVFEDVDDVFTDKPGDKLLKEIPYISIAIGSQVSLRTLNRANFFQTIDIADDSEDDFNSSPKFSEIKKKSINDSAKKTPFKIKFSSSFSRSLTLKTTQQLYVCNICDKEYAVRCDYLLHLLRHEQIESLVINVVRHNLPTHVKAQKFEKTCTEKPKRLSVPSRRINNLLAKWIGDHAGNTFDESFKEDEVRNTSLSTQDVGMAEEDGSAKEILNNNDLDSTKSDEPTNTNDSVGLNDRSETNVVKNQDVNDEPGVDIEESGEPNVETSNQTNEDESRNVDRSKGIKPSITSRRQSILKNPMRLSTPDKAISSAEMEDDTKTREESDEENGERSNQTNEGEYRKVDQTKEITPTISSRRSSMFLSLDDTEGNDPTKRREFSKVTSSSESEDDTNGEQEHRKTATPEENHKNTEQGESLRKRRKSIAEESDNDKNDVNVDEHSKSDSNDEGSVQSPVNNEVDARESDKGSVKIGDNEGSSSFASKTTKDTVARSLFSSKRSNEQTATPNDRDNSQCISPLAKKREKRKRNDNDDEFSSGESNTEKLDLVLTSEDLLNILESNIEASSGSKDELTKKSRRRSQSHSPSSDETEDEIASTKGSDPENEGSDTGSSSNIKNRDACTEGEPEETPRRKRVRFASEKEIVTSDKSKVLEKLSEI